MENSKSTRSIEYDFDHKLPYGDTVSLEFLIGMSIPIDPDLRHISRSCFLQKLEKFVNG